MESTDLLRVLEERPEFRSHLKMLGIGEYTNGSKEIDSAQTGASFIKFKPTSPLFEVSIEQINCDCL